jgi:hypothetical protein
LNGFSTANDSVSNRFTLFDAMSLCFTFSVVLFLSYLRGFDYLTSSTIDIDVMTLHYITLTFAGLVVVIGLRHSYRAWSMTFEQHRKGGEQTVYIEQLIASLVSALSSAWSVSLFVCHILWNHHDISVSTCFTANILINSAFATAFFGLMNAKSKYIANITKVRSLAHTLTALSLSSLRCPRRMLWKLKDFLYDMFHTRSVHLLIPLSLA